MEDIRSAFLWVATAASRLDSRNIKHAGGFCSDRHKCCSSNHDSRAYLLIRHCFAIDRRSLYSVVNFQETEMEQDSIAKKEILDMGSDDVKSKCFLWPLRVFFQFLQF